MILLRFAVQKPLEMSVKYFEFWISSGWFMMIGS